jgi:putative (di)nucleoside polyphosphate hydrolase
MSLLPYRRNVGAVLFSPAGGVFVARRAVQPGRASGAGGWQLPQGGLDEGEDPAEAVLRELAEEIGTRSVAILAEHPEWLSYDLPPEAAKASWGGRYRGQTQKWFALRFLGADAEIRLDAEQPPEFDAWRWAALGELPGLAVGFKRPIYERLAEDFARFAR